LADDCPEPIYLYPSPFRLDHVTMSCVDTLLIVSFPSLVREVLCLLHGKIIPVA
jgi:hypothetical protein